MTRRGVRGSNLQSVGRQCVVEVLREVLGTPTNVFPLRRVELDRLEGVDSASVDLIYSSFPAPRDDAHVELRRQEFAVASALQPVRAILGPYDTFFAVLHVLEPVRTSRDVIPRAFDSAQVVTESSCVLDDARELGFRNSLPALQCDVPLDNVSVVDAYVAVFWSLQHGRWAIVLYGRDLIDDGCMFPKDVLVPRVRARFGFILEPESAHELIGGRSSLELRARDFNVARVDDDFFNSNISKNSSIVSEDGIDHTDAAGIVQGVVRGVQGFIEKLFIYLSQFAVPEHLFAAKKPCTQQLSLV